MAVVVPPAIDSPMKMQSEKLASFFPRRADRSMISAASGIAVSNLMSLPAEPFMSTKGTAGFLRRPLVTKREGIPERLRAAFVTTAGVVAPSGDSGIAGMVTILWSSTSSASALGV